MGRRIRASKNYLDSYACRKKSINYAFNIENYMINLSNVDLDQLAYAIRNSVQTEFKSVFVSLRSCQFQLYLLHFILEKT